MVRLLIYAVCAFVIVMVASDWLRRRQLIKSNPVKPKKKKFKKKDYPGHWAQVYETDSENEAQKILVRLEEENIPCILFEQGKKDIHGNSMKRLGLVVPKTHLGYAQSIISRLPV